MTLAQVEIPLLVQAGALGLLALHLLWSVRERVMDRKARADELAAERADRAALQTAERVARVAELTAIAQAHRDQVASVLAAMKEAYDGSTHQECRRLDHELRTLRRYVHRIGPAVKVFPSETDQPTGYTPPSP